MSQLYVWHRHDDSAFVTSWGAVHMRRGRGIEASFETYSSRIYYDSVRSECVKPPPAALALRQTDHPGAIASSRLASLLRMTRPSWVEQMAAALQAASV